jgi:hypothetical protein
VASELAVSKDTIRLINQQLAQVYQDNKQLLL